ncbi:Pumilio domain-containing protein C6G9.14 [Biomphalaria pfeifferi]|uniref:Pumilio domain-containing protein C6G9.14 n=1 Tax=Biomphalaria pfeifferi TaxID=112525 RepID=A0AAD8ANY8_BIOPF|nr:Pumilio domain-containing protein C6G9.14 [Biomphalaria pfeifferi]
MNLAVEAPSKIVRLSIGEKSSSKVSEWEEELSTPACCTDEDSEERPAVKSISIDFFNLDESGMESCKPGKSILSRPVRKSMLEEEFFRNSLRNDIRVVDVKYSKTAIFVYFSNLEDSVSFYRQFLPYAEISFSEAYDIEQMMLLSSSEWTRLALKEHSEHVEEEPMLCFDERPEGVVRSVKSVQESVFEKKVEYFSNLRNFFSKNDVKLMAQSLEAGNIDFIFRNTKEMAVGNHTNKLMQDAIKLLSEEEIGQVIESLGEDIAPIAANKHGAYTVQMLISASKTSATQDMLSRHFRYMGRFLIVHEIGNYAIQKILRFDPDLVFDFFMSSMADVVKSELGMKVLKRCLDFFTDKRAALVEKAREYAERDCGNIVFSCF